MEGFLESTFYGNTIFAWLRALAIIVAALLVGKTAYWIFQNVARRLTAKTQTKLDDIVLDMIEEPIVVILTVFGFAIGINTLEFDSERVSDFLDHTMTAAITLSVAWLVARLLDALIQEYVVPLTEKTKSDLDDQLLPILRKGTKLAVWAIGVIVALNNAGYDVGALLAGLGVGGLALAIAAQDTVANIFGGATIFADRPFVLGDRVRVGGYDGVIREIGIRSSRIETRDGAMVTMPNSKFTSSAVENVSAGSGRRIVLNLGLVYDTTPEQMEQAMEILRQIAADNDNVTDDVKVSFSSWGDSALGIRFAFFVRLDRNFRQTENAINLEILRRFHAAGLEFAYPTRTVYTVAPS
ncbi:MAG: mechanosensitive ion channel family protein [Acidobacteria bacterium]|nr:MAG: mechanosensitive ion channel family protein [Acidobacteriota bacterium]